MSTCTFFGHRQCPTGLRPQLQSVLIDLIVTQRVHTFYVGNQGSFECMVASVLDKLCQEYPNITYGIVFPCLPIKQPVAETDTAGNSRSIVSEGIEKIAKPLSIDWRNRWMLDRADYVVTYVTHPWGEAAKFAQLAQRMGKRVVNLDPPSSMISYIGRL